MDFLSTYHLQGLVLGLCSFLIIGICQAVAVIPGLSRLSLSVTCATAEGFQKGYAIRFGMLMAIPAMFGASILSLADAAMAGIDTSRLKASRRGSTLRRIRLIVPSPLPGS